MNEQTDLEILREVLIRELETINSYTAMARRAQDPAVRSLLEHISRDEEEHVAECIQWIGRLNPVMASFLTRQPEHVMDGRAQGALSTAPVVAAPHMTGPAPSARPSDSSPLRSASASTTGEGRDTPPTASGSSGDSLRRPIPPLLGRSREDGVAALTIGSLVRERQDGE